MQRVYFFSKFKVKTYRWNCIYNQMPLVPELSETSVSVKVNYVSVLLPE